jgi:hypothetical protein
MLGNLRAAGSGTPVPLRPGRHGLSDHVDLWYSLSMGQRPRGFKRALRTAFKAASRATRSPVVPSLSLAFRKADDGSARG